MKKIIFLSFVLSMSLAHAKLGSEGVGGGDLCEDRIKVVRDDIRGWILGGGPAGLALPQGMSVKDYSDGMLEQIEHAQIRCVSAGDEGYPVSVEGVAKVCRFDSNESGSMITCDYNKFQAIKEADQYVLVHHEYAGLSNVEIPNGSDSDYSVSNQLSGYLVNQIVKKLSVKPGAVKSYEILKSYSSNQFAIAWGIPGKKINFDIFNDLEENDIFNYVEKNNMNNYVVDLRNEKILMTLDSGPVLFKIGNRLAGGNHYDLDLSPLLIAGLPNCVASIAVLESWKWTTDLSQLILSNSCVESKPLIINPKELNESIQKQMRKFVNKKYLSIFDASAVTMDVKDSTFYKEEEVNRIRYDYEIPKALDKMLKLEAVIKLTYKDNKVTAKVLAVEQRVE